MTRIVPISIGFVLGAVVGIGIGSLLQSDDSSAANSLADATKLERSRSTSLAGDFATSPAVDSRASQTESTTAEHATLEQGSPSAAEVTRGEAVSEVVAPAEGTIGGRVVDPIGNPLPGVVIVAETSGFDSGEETAGPSSRGREAPRPSSLEDVLAETREDYRRRLLSRGEAVTDDRGEYRLEGLRQTRYELSGWADGYIVESLANTSGVEPGQRVDFSATLAVDIPVTVRLPNGEVAARASLAIDHEARSEAHQELWTKESPAVRLGHGRYRIHAFARWMRDGVGQPAIETISEKVLLDLSSGGAPATVELTLRPRLGIRGRVRFGELMLADFVRVKLAALPAGQELELDVLRRIDTEEWVEPSAPAFAFPDLKPGRYGIGLLLDSESPLLATRVIEIVDRMVDVDLEIANLDSLRTVTATVFGPGNELVEDVSFYFRVRRGDDEDFEVDDLNRIQLARGRYAVILEDRVARYLDQPDAETTVFLVARTDRFGSHSVPLDARTKAVEIRVPEPAFLEVQLTGYGSSGVESRLTMRLDAVGANNRGGWDSSLEFQADGSGRIGPNAPGNYELELSLLRTHGWGTRALHKRSLTLNAGENRLSLPIPQLHTLTILLPGVAEGTVTLESSLGDDEEAAVLDGRASLGELPAATYSIYYEDENGERNLEFHIPDQTTVTLPQPPPRDPEPNDDGEGEGEGEGG